MKIWGKAKVARAKAQAMPRARPAIHLVKGAATIHLRRVSNIQGAGLVVENSI